MSETAAAEVHALARVVDELNYYELLEVARSASIADVRKGYHQVRRRFHPDASRNLDVPYAKTSNGSPSAWQKPTRCSEIRGAVASTTNGCRKTGKPCVCNSSKRSAKPTVPRKPTPEPHPTAGASSEWPKRTTGRAT